MTRSLVLTAAALLAMPAAATEVLEPDDLLDEVTVTAPAVSPDGKWLVYSVTRFDREKKARDGDLWLVPVAGGEPRRLTATPGVESGPAWAPDSRRVAFAAKRGDDKQAQVYVLDVTGGEAVRLTAMTEGAGDPRFSPDGGLVAFTSSVGAHLSQAQRDAFGDVRFAMHPRFYHLGRGWDDGARQRIFVIPAAGGEARQLTDGSCSDEGDHEMAWSPDSREIAFVSNRSPEWWNTIDTDVWVVSVAEGALRRLTTNPGPDHDPAFSPDGRWIAYRASHEYNYESEDYTIQVVPRAGGAPRELGAALDRSADQPAWSPDSREIYFLLASEGTRNLYAVTAAAPERVRTVTSGVQTIQEFAPLGGDRFVVRRSTDVLPGEMWSLAGGTFTRLTREAGRFWERFAVQPCEEIVERAEDGTRLQGWLVRPAGLAAGTRAPLVLQIHGGPHGMYSPQLRFATQLLAARGYAVLLTNPRGSAGYGQAFADAIHGDWHTRPMADLERFVDRAVAMGVADPEKLAVMGGSYGGYMTNWLIGHTDRFAAAVSVAGLANLVSFFGTTDEQFFAEKEMAGPPWRSREAYLENSPLWAAEHFSTPTMVIHGENDWRVRPEQGQQLFTALQKIGVPSVYVEFPGEQHGVSRPPHQVAYQRLVLEWFDHWLLGRPVELATYVTPRPYVHPPTSAEDKSAPAAR